MGGRAHLGFGVLVEDAEHGEFGGDGLARAGGGPQQDAGVAVVERVEDLRLDGVEVRELVQALVLSAAQGRDGQGLQVQQLCGGFREWTLGER